MCASGIGEEGKAVLAIFMLLVPAVFYVLGLLRGRTGTVFIFLGLVAHLANFVYRGMEIGTIPLTEKHDTISFMALSTVLCFLYFRDRDNSGNVSVLALPVASLLLIVAALFPPINSVPPFQQTPWFYLYTFFFFMSYGFLGISFSFGMLFLVRRDDLFEQLQYRTAVYGWILYSLSLLAGSIWFFLAYGMYWLWTSKELWTMLTWFYLGMYLHARLMKGLKGMPASVMGTAGFLVALFAYFGVGTVIPSPPTQF